MEAVRQIIDSNSLNGIIALPEVYQNKKVEVTVSLVEEKRDLPALNKEDLDAMLTGSVTESLIGIIPYSGMSLNDYKAERLHKYECTY